MSEEKQSISSEEVGSLGEALGENDPILRPVSKPEPEPEIQDPVEHYRAKKGINLNK